MGGGGGEEEGRWRRADPGEPFAGPGNSHPSLIDLFVNYTTFGNGWLETFEEVLVESLLRVAQQ